MQYEKYVKDQALILTEIQVLAPAVTAVSVSSVGVLVTSSVSLTPSEIDAISAHNCYTMRATS